MPNSNNYDDLRNRYNELQRVPEDADRAWFQNRGREFENLLKDLLTLEGLEPRIRIRPIGQEIDGSFYFNGRYILIEAKWHRNSTPASQIFAFKGKVNGKLIGTLGVFISISKFSKDAVKAVICGQKINILLFDQEDFEFCLNSEIGFSQVLKFKLRAAAEQGLICIHYSSNNIEFGKRTEERPITIETLPVIQQTREGFENVFILCEGKIDKLIITTILSRFSLEYLSIRIIDMYGYLNITKLLENFNNNLLIDTLLRNYNKLIVVADGDFQRENRSEFFHHLLMNSSIPYEIVIPEPEIEIWLRPNSSDPKREIRLEARENNIPIYQYIATLAQNINLNDIYNSEDGSFRRFKDFLVPPNE